jgi:pSer/pThr/pTyr-binding forkhead associated (FHA) protein
MMIPLSNFVEDARKLTEPQFCAKHTTPVLIQWSSQGSAAGKRDTKMVTLDRLVLKKPVTATERALIENYRVGVLTTRRPSGWVLVGFSSQCDIVLDESSVSRVHAYFFKTVGWHVKDAESSAGTLVNDQPPTGAALVTGDRITLGNVDVLFLDPVQLFRLIHRIELF